MKEFFRLLRRFIPPYKKYLVSALFLNLLSAVLNIFSFSLIIPILQILFELDAKVYEFIPWDTAGIGLKDLLINNFYYYVTQMINVQGASITLLVLGLFLIVMTLFKTLSYFASSASIIPLRTGVVRDIRRMVYDKVLRLPLGFFSEERKGDIISKITSDSHIVAVASGDRHPYALIYPVPDKPSGKCRITFISFPILFKVTDCIPHRMRIFANDMRFHHFSVIRFFQTLFTYAFQPFHILIRGQKEEQVDILNH